MQSSGFLYYLINRNLGNTGYSEVKYPQRFIEAAMTNLRKAFTKIGNIENDTLIEDQKCARSALFTETKIMRLLLIEDEAADIVLACDLIKECMPEFQWEIEVAKTMTDAIAALSDFRFDLALVDLGLRDTEGPQTIDMLCLAAPEIPLVVFSATENDAILRESLRRGAYMCLQKSKTTPDAMRTVLISALSRDTSKS